MMIRYYFKTAWRSIRQNRTYFLTNIIGLTVGLISLMLLTSLLSNELSFDKQWANKDELYRVRTAFVNEDGEETWRMAEAPSGLAHALSEQFPEATDYTRISHKQETLLLDAAKKTAADLKLLHADSNFFNLFETQALQGNPKQRVGHLKNLVLTQSAATRYFADQDIIGRVIETRPYEGEPETYYINAIIADLPQNSHLHADAILVQPSSEAFTPAIFADNQGQYLRLTKGTDIAKMDDKINQWVKTNDPNQNYKNSRYSLQSIKDIHLRSETGWNSAMRNIYLLSSISVLIVLLLMFNYINLNFAQALKHSVNTGIHKVLGASNRQLYIQAGAESSLFFSLSFVMAYIAYALLLPLFESYLQYPLTMTFIKSAPMLLSLLILWLTIGFICSMPGAHSLAKTKVAYALKKKISVLSVPLKAGVTRFLVVLQFAIALIIVCGMVAIRSQLQYIDQKDLGYNPKNLLLINFTNWEQQAKVFKETLLKRPSIQSASFSQWTPFSGGLDIKEVDSPNGNNAKQTFASFPADLDLPETLQIKLLDGRYLNEKYADDIFLYSPETANRAIRSNVLITAGLISSLQLHIDEGSTNLQHTPVGTIGDLHAGSLHHDLLGFIIEGQQEWDEGALMIRFAEGQEKEARTIVSDTWNQFYADKTLQINAMESLVKQQYKKEQSEYQQLAFFSGISLFIAFLGILGLSTFTTERRVKEIGIRRVLGAPISAIIALLSTSFLKLVGLAFVIAFPIVSFLITKWLDNFAYRIELPYILFIIVGLGTLTMTLILVGSKAVRAARANPVDSLRDE